jgi:Spy/CpxP family protein refolding chaperone
MLKHIICICLISVFVPACGQDQDRGPRMSPAETVKILKDRLDLTEEQQAQIEKILVESRAEMQEFRQSFSGDRGEMRDKMREMRDATDERVKDLLNDEQKLKFEEYREERMKNMRGRFRENRGARD